MELNTFAIALAFAIGLEGEAMRFYTEATQTEKYSAAKEAFLALAEEHKRHQKALVRIQREEDVSDADTSAFRLPVSGLQQSDYLANLKLAPEMGYADVLRLGMEAEEKAGKFHLDVASILKPLLPSLSRNFEKLARENGNHQEKIKTLFNKTGETESGNRVG